MIKDKIYIGGQWVKPDSKQVIEVESPIDRSIIGSVPSCNELDVNRAVKSAKEAFPKWKELGLEKRKSYIVKLLASLKENTDKLARVISMELGCTEKMAKSGHLLWYYESIEDFIKISDDYDFERKYDGYIVLKEPVGVVGALTPWNYPFGQIIKKIIPALIAGNTIVLKPSQITPLIAYELTEIIYEVGFPEGVFNLVTGKGSEIGEIISSHKDIDVVSFTGSTEAGRKVGENGIRNIKRVTLELGGKSAGLLLKSGDVDLAAKVVLSTVYSNVGQTCSALTRLVAPRSLKEDLERSLIQETEKYTFGDPREDGVRVGPLVSLKQFEKVGKYVDIGLEEGAKILHGSKPKDHNKGYYFGPIIFTDVDNSMRIAQEEIFGPVLSIIYYDDLEGAIRIVNDSAYGLSGAIFGDEDEAYEIAKRLDTGNIIINEGDKTVNAPFGGYKDSGLGREGGIYGFDEYVEIKAIFIN